MTLDEKVDKILNEVKSGQSVLIYPTIASTIEGTDLNEQRIIVRYMQDELLIEEYGLRSGGLSFKIAPKGWKIQNEIGGWLAYLEIKRNEENEFIKLQRDNESFQKRIQATNTKINIGLLIVGVISAILLGYGIYQTDKTNTLEKKLTEVTKIKDSLFLVTVDQYNLLKTKDTEITKTNFSLDSLRDSLTVDNKVKRK